MIKIKKIFKTNESFLDTMEFEDFLRSVGHYYSGTFKVSVSLKVGKRRKLKKRVIEYRNVCNCDCCGPYYKAEFVK